MRITANSMSRTDNKKKKKKPKRDNTSGYIFKWAEREDNRK